MMMSWTAKERAAKPTRSAGMYGVCLQAVRSLSLVNNFGGRLGQETSMDSRHIRH